MGLCFHGAVHGVTVLVFSLPLRKLTLDTLLLSYFKSVTDIFFRNELKMSGVCFMKNLQRTAPSVTCWLLGQKPGVLSLTPSAAFMFTCCKGTLLDRTLKIKSVLSAFSNRVLPPSPLPVCLPLHCL